MKNSRTILITGLLVLAVSAVFYCKTNTVFGQACTITGNFLPNVLTGTNGPDVICGKAGGDTIYGKCGTDILNGDSGYDYIYFNGTFSDVDICNVGLGGGICICPDPKCWRTCQHDFMLKATVLPVSTGNGAQLIGDFESKVDIVVFGSKNNTISLEGIAPATTAKKRFAMKGFEESTGLPEISSPENMIAAFGSYSVKADAEIEGVVIVEIPAYTKEQSLVAASEIFIPDGDTYIMYDHNSCSEAVLKDMDYIRFSNSALIPVQ